MSEARISLKGSDFEINFHRSANGDWCGHIDDTRYFYNSDPLALALDEIVHLRAELERTRQAWVDGDDPMCEDVCMAVCKGPCGVGEADR